MTHFFLLRLDNLAALYRAVGGRRLRVALALAGIDSVGDDLIAFGLLVGPGGDGTGQRQGGSGGSNEHILWFYQPPFGTCWFFDACVPGDVSAHRLNRRRICDTKRIEGFATRGRRITVSPRSVPRATGDAVWRLQRHCAGLRSLDHRRRHLLARPPK